MYEPDDMKVCSFLRELLFTLAQQQPSWPLTEHESLLQRLLDLEKRARESAAAPASQEAIASVRRLAAIAATSPLMTRVCGH